MFLRATCIFPGWELTVQVDLRLPEQMLNELMTPGNAIAGIEALTQILAARDRSEDRREQDHVVALANEAAVWENR